MNDHGWAAVATHVSLGDAVGCVFQWGETEAPPVVFVVDPVRGETYRVRVPGFPSAFGAPDLVYVADEHPETEEHILVRYELRGEGG